MHEEKKHLWVPDYYVYMGKLILGCVHSFCVCFCVYGSEGVLIYV